MKISVENGEVVVRMPIPADPTQCPVSKSGNNYVVATTHGFTPVPGTNMKLAINLISPVGSSKKEKLNTGIATLRELLKKGNQI